MNDHVAVVDLLLTVRADPNCVDKVGALPLAMAIHNKNYDLIICLKLVNASIYINDSNVNDSKHSMFELALQDSYDNKLCNLLLNSGKLLSREGWLFANYIPDAVDKMGA